MSVGRWEGHEQDSCLSSAYSVLVYIRASVAHVFYQKLEIQSNFPMITEWLSLHDKVLRSSHCGSLMSVLGNNPVDGPGQRCALTELQPGGPSTQDLLRHDQETNWDQCVS